MFFKLRKEVLVRKRPISIKDFVYHSLCLQVGFECDGIKHTITRQDYNIVGDRIALTYGWNSNQGRASLSHFLRNDNRLKNITVEKRTLRAV